MSPRLSRVEQNDRNRALLFAAARRVFLAKGYHAATLEQIADEAGFSKGVVYSRFASKADMVLALLEDRIEERGAQTAKASAPLTGSGNFAALLDLGQQAERSAPGWRLLVTEFRIHASRDPELNRRYAALHSRAVEGVARTLVVISEQGEQSLPFPPRQLAELLLAVEAGLVVEQPAAPDALGGPVLTVVRWLITRLAPAPVLSEE